jgi:hypothetical protein
VDKFAATLNKQIDQLQRDVITLETEIKSDDASDHRADIGRDLHGLTPSPIAILSGIGSRRGTRVRTH